MLTPIEQVCVLTHIQVQKIEMGKKKKRNREKKEQDKCPLDKTH